MEEKKEWFAEWFDTIYYHILYNNRDYAEAERFINKLSQELNLPLASKILDLACGKGRHALQLRELGYDVLGTDLSPNSITEANKFARAGLRFEVADMRIPLPNLKFNAVLNLFTSFGYFNSMDENLKVLNSIADMLETNGIFVIDFMNCKKVITNLVSQETITKEGVTFEIARKVTNNQILKTINIAYDGKKHTYQESVQALTLENFRDLIDQTDLQIDTVFGNYELEPFDEITSNRLIIVGRKN